MLAAAWLPLTAVHAAELTGRFSMLGTTAQAEPGDSGYIDDNHNTLTADQQSLRLMLDVLQDQSEWTLHIKTARQHSNAFAPAAQHSSTLFRYHDVAGDWVDENNSTSSTRIGYELDRAAFTQHAGNITVSLGRQPVDWGSGRFWQPLNVFGAFAPTDLDTDSKQGRAPS